MELVTAHSDDVRKFCAAGLLGLHPEPSRFCDAHGRRAVTATAEAEGVLVALHASLPSDSPIRAELAPAMREAIARNLLCLVQARAIQQALDAAGIPCIWLKGIALGQWLYPSPHLRDVADVDLLLPDHAATLRAAVVLAPLGYTLLNPHIAGDLVVHELLALHAGSGLELDLHWSLSNDALFANRLDWDELWGAAITLPGLAPNAKGLGAEHAFLHACMHRALNHLTAKHDRLRWLYDLHLIAGQLSPEQWHRVLELAVARKLADACLEALMATQRTFQTEVPDDVIQVLLVAASNESLRCARLGSWGYFQRATWRALPDLRTRLRWSRQLLIPDLAHLRTRYGQDGAGHLRILWRRMYDGVARWRRYQ